MNRVGASTLPPGLTYDYFDKAWGRVLASLRSRFETGPVDRTEHLAKMEAMMEKQKEKAGGKS